MEELEKIFIEMLDHIDNHKESYNKPQWTNEAIVKTWLKANEHKLKLLGIADVSGSAFRYPMTYDQPCQIDCRVTSCKFYKGAGKCENVSPAITLNENGKFVCWSQADR